MKPTRIPMRLVVGALPGTTGYHGKAASFSLRGGRDVIVLAATQEDLDAAANALWLGMHPGLDPAYCPDAVLVSPTKLVVGAVQPDEDDEEL